VREQSRMLQALTCLRRFVWEDHQALDTPDATSIPWPALPATLEELELLSEASNNWDVLLPLRHLRRLTLPERAVGDHSVVRTLGKMPWVPHVQYSGRTCGERAHRVTQPWRVHSWLHQLARGPVDFGFDDSDDCDELDEDGSGGAGYCDYHGAGWGYEDDNPYHRYSSHGYHSGPD